MERFQQLRTSLYALTLVAVASDSVAQGLAAQGERSIIHDPKIEGPIPPGRIVEDQSPLPTNTEEDPLRFDSDTPDWQNEPARERAESQIKRRVALWRQRIIEFSQKAEQSGDKDVIRLGDQLELQWMSLRQNYEKILQSRTTQHWRKSYFDLANINAELAALWDRAQVTATDPRN